MLGVCWAGATYVPIGSRIPEDRLLAILSQADLSVLIVDKDGLDVLTERVLAASPDLVIIADVQDLPCGQGRIRLIDRDALRAVEFDETPPPRPMAADETAYVIHTSGTTGAPKGVMISVGAAIHYVSTMSHLVGLRASDRVLDTFDLTFDVSVHNLFTTWHSGATLYILPASQVMNALNFVRTNQLTVWSLVSSFAAMFQLTGLATPQSLPALRVTMFGGEPLTTGIVEFWRNIAPNTAIYNLYGPTEATVTCLALRVPEVLPRAPGAGTIAIGRPLPGVEAAVFDDCSGVVADGTAGELAISGIQLAQGYLGEAPVPDRRFPVLRGKRWYLTGDRVIRDESGTFHFLGRNDHQVKILGHRVELEEIEHHLRDVTRAPLVCAVPWPVVDGKPMGVVGVVGSAAVDAQQVLNALGARLPEYMLPTDVVAMECIPLTRTGKIDRRALHERVDSQLR